MKKDDCIAYKGIKFTIEWFYDDHGNSQAFEYYHSLSHAQKRKLLMLFNRIGEFGKINDKTKFRYEGDDIFTFKPQPDRYFSFFVKGNKIIVAHAFRKKSDKSPPMKKLKPLKIEKIISDETRMGNIMNRPITTKINLSTFDKFMQDPEQKKKYDKEYNKFLLSEFLLEAMEENNISVRKLAEKSGVAPSIIQNIRSEKTQNVTFNTLNSIFSSLGYRMSFEKIKIS